MNFEKMMCDRLGYKYQDIFNHLGFTLNKMNMFLNTYGCGFNDDELEKINDLIFKLQTGKAEIIEFTRPAEEYLDVDKIYRENKELKERIKDLESEVN